MAYFVAAMAAFSASELVMHLYFGIRAVQGEPTHFAVMGAGLVGVALGGVLANARRSGPSALVSAVDERMPECTADEMNKRDITGSEQRSNLALHPAAARLAR